ncbi:MAG: hypothetical protein JW971_01065 [Synergistales bacterium]|nr:hypothetical protein [Synergistales bacterium]
MRSRTAILIMVLLLVISIFVVLSVSGPRDRGIPDDASSSDFRERPEGQLTEESLVGIVRILTEDESNFPTEPMIYIRAFWEHIVRAPEDASFFRRIINFLLAVRGQNS